MTINELLGIRLPIVQAPMAGVQDSALAIAVCEAGGLGSLPCAMLRPEQIQAEVTAIRAATSAPFNLNFFCHAVGAEDPSLETAWRDALRPYYLELGLAQDGIVDGPARNPFDDDMLALLEEIRPPVVSFHFGLPDVKAVARLKALGCKILCSATSVPEARFLAEHGADAIIAQGIEAGGHRGMFLELDIASQVGTFALVPGIVAAVNVPVIAAGGISSAAGVSAAMALGASGVQIGTAYLLCPEARTGQLHRQALKSPGAERTAITNVFTGRPARSIVNRLVSEQGPMSASVPAFPRAANVLAPIRAASEAKGSSDFSSLWCGQNAAGCDEIPAAKMTRRLMSALAGADQ